MCDRPTYISFDGNCPVYETGQAVMQYADGFTITGTVEGGPTPEDLQFTFPEAANWSEFIPSAPEGDDRFLSHLILELTKEQEALIPVARQKWKGMIFQTDEIDRLRVTETVQAAYAAIGSTAPEIVFCSSPHAALVEHQVGNQGEEQVGEELDGRFDRLLWSDLENELESQLGFKLEKRLTRELNQELKQMYFNSGESKLSTRLGSEYDIIDLGWFVQPAWWACAGAYIDFCVSVLNCVHNPEKWRIFQALVQHCGWIFPYTKVCYVCERPVSLFVPVDEDDCLTNLNEPLIQFADGFSLFLQPEQDYSDFEQDDLQE